MGLGEHRQQQRRGGDEEGETAEQHLPGQVDQPKVTDERTDRDDDGDRHEAVEDTDHGVSLAVVAIALLRRPGGALP